MKKIFILSFLYLNGLFSLAQEYSSEYSVISNCDFVKNNLHEQEYALGIINVQTDSMYIILLQKGDPYSSYPLNAKITDANRIVIKPLNLDYLHGYDCIGEGTITKDEIHLNCIMTYPSSEDKTCQINSIIPNFIYGYNKKRLFSPNPVKDILTLTLPNAENEIKIFDLQGKLWLQQSVGYSAEINVSMLPAGMYVLVVNEESYKFVKE